MTEIEIFISDFNHHHLIESFTEKLSMAINVKVRIGLTTESIDPFYDTERSQFDAAKIIKYYSEKLRSDKGLVLTSQDLFIPIFTYIFGLAQLGGPVAVVSTLRLDDTFYGLPVNDDKLLKRLLKEAVHEIGHLYSLRHCVDYQCVMANSTTADELDIKEAEFCSDCKHYIPGFAQGFKPV